MVNRKLQFEIDDLAEYHEELWCAYLNCTNEEEADDLYNAISETQCKYAELCKKAKIDNYLDLVF